MFRFTKNGWLVLELFFKNPEKSLYTRQIGRLLNKEPGIFQRDLTKLAKDEILLSQKQGNNVYYNLNQNYFLFSELKNIFSKTTGIEAQLKKLLNSFPEKIKKAYVYGSVAIGKETSSSDIDLLLVGTVDEPLMASEISNLERTLGREIHYVIMLPEEYLKKKSGGDSFLNDIESKPIINLI